MGFKSRQQSPGAARAARDELEIPARVRREHLAREEYLCWPDRRDVRYVIVAVVRREGDVRPPLRGRVMVGPMIGRRGYDYHRELPVEGVGVSVERVWVLERDERGAIIRTPYRQWRWSLGVVVLCPRCRVDLARDDSGPCERTPGVVLLARPVATATLPWWPRRGPGYAWVTVYFGGWTLGVDAGKRVPLGRVARLQEWFLDQYAELACMKPRRGNPTWEWKTTQ